ncbi:MAG: hypothetical protein WEB00_14890 [Dehalococcoidia bacterium]
MTASTALAAKSVLSPKGEKVPLGEILAEQPTVLVFVRHFG